MQVDEVLRLRRKMRKSRKGRMYTATSGGLDPERSMAKQLGEGDAPHLKAGSLEEAAAGLQLMIFESRIHDGISSC